MILNFVFKPPELPRTPSPQQVHHSAAERRTEICFLETFLSQLLFTVNYRIGLLYPYYTLLKTYQIL